MSEGQADPEVYALAYTASVDALKQQDTTLGNLRTRANSLLATGALVTSLTSGLGLYFTDASKGPTIRTEAAWGIVAVLLLMGAATLHVLWPVKSWSFGPDARLLLTATEENGQDKAAVQKDFATRLTECRIENAKILARRVRSYQIAVLLLLVEVVVLVLALA